MADGAEKLARLKALKSGLKAKSAPPVDEDSDLPSLDSMFGEEVASAPAPASDPAPAAKAEASDPESLSAYFEALGIVPDAAKGKDAPAAPPVEKSSDPAPAPAAAKGREVDIRDRWADPVREDDRFLSSFAGSDTPVNDEPVAEAVQDDPAPEPIPEAMVQEEPPSDTQDAPDMWPDFPADVEAEAAPDEMPPAPDEEPAPEEESVASDDAPAEEFAGFGGDIDIDAFEREIAEAERAKAARMAVAEEAAAPAPDSGSAADLGPDPVAEPEPEPIVPPAPNPVAEMFDDDSLSVTFDAGRAAMLNQVSAQMGCTVDDVVVTAIDWYLDALFGEDGEMQGASAGE